MPTITFWNLNRNVAPSEVAALAREWDTDILILAENRSAPIELLKALNERQKRLFFPDRGLSGRLAILTRFEPQPSTLVRDSLGVSIRHYKLPIGDSFLLVAVHLPSKLRRKTEDQILGATRLARYIREAEELVGHQRTILIGDLNMNPFEVGVIGSDGLHAVMDRRIASRGSRVVNGDVCTYFYNPMWGAFGDNDTSPPGTYFYNSGTEVNYYWHVFDQVLLRPGLIECVSEDSINIVTDIDGITLLSSVGRPDHVYHSDHLPLVCRLKEIKEVPGVIKELVG